jgi:hypothetical protein
MSRSLPGSAERGALRPAPEFSGENLMRVVPRRRDGPGDSSVEKTGDPCRDKLHQTEFNSLWYLKLAHGAADRTAVFDNKIADQRIGSAGVLFVNAVAAGKHLDECTGQTLRRLGGVGY